MEKSDVVIHAKNPHAHAKLCGAQARTNNHQPCRQPAMKNGRCRLHGGKCTGPKTPEGKLKSAMAPYKHGRYTKKAIEERRRNSMLLKEWKNDLTDIESMKQKI
jgi:hypothetical protein